MREVKGKLFALAGFTFLAIAAIGVVVPLLPTTPFLIVAAACLSKGSVRVHDWLINRSLWGPLLLDWERDGIIRMRSKVVATLLIITFASYPLLVMAFADYLKLAAVVSIAAILLFIWTRPSE
ncbi:MAG: YbaN family protein, partial [Planctomycetes bacterium]|nr:YbaN family protein [Planctomycetota bacterium]